MSVVHNPRSGEVIAVRAGETVIVRIDVQNDNPYEQAGFYFDTNLPDGWWEGPSKSSPDYVAASSDAQLSLQISPPPATGNTELNSVVIRISVEGSVTSVPPDIPVVLKVEKASVPKPPPVPPVEQEPDIEPPVTEQREPLPELIHVPIEEEHESEAVDDEPEQVAEPAPPVPPSVAPPMLIKDKAKSTEDIISIRSQSESGVRRGAPLPPPPDTDRQVADPENMEVLHILPGESMLVRFRFYNSQEHACTYILDEDRHLCLPEGWLDRLQAEVNLTPNAEGEAFCKIAPPVSAPPGEYPFILHLGPQHGAGPEERTLTLRVLATPAVRLSAANPLAKVGPFASSADFQLVTANAGNAETAFRVAVRSPQTDSVIDDDTADPKDIYEHGDWTYHFDRELDTLRSKVAGREPEPRSVRLRVRRRGYWWWGMREEHTVTARAVPVTDPSNGGRSESTATMTIQHWRLVPFPYTLLIPIVLILVMLTGRAGNLRVTNALHVPGENVYYILGSAPVTAHIKWSAVPLVPQRLVITDAASAFSVLHRYDYSADSSSTDGSNATKYVKSTSCSVRNQNINMVFMFAKTSGALRLSVQGPNGWLNLTGHEPERIGEERISVPGAQYLLEIPVSEDIEKPVFCRLVFTNTDTTGTQVRVRPISIPTDGSFEIRDCTEKPPESGATSLPIKIAALRPGASGDMLLATTDRAQQVIRIRLEAR